MTKEEFNNAKKFNNYNDYVKSFDSITNVKLEKIKDYIENYVIIQNSDCDMYTLGKITEKGNLSPDEFIEGTSQCGFCISDGSVFLLMIFTKL